MACAQLHLVDDKGRDVLPSIKSAVESAFGWAVHTFPNLDPAVLAGWAEEIGISMQRNANTHASPRRYAYAAMHGRVRDWLRTGASKEMPSGVGSDLEQWAGIDGLVQHNVDRKILFEELKAKLDNRDQHILVLLLQDITSASSVGKSLGISESAAAKAIQRLKARMARLIVSSTVNKCGSGPGLNKLCETKG